MTFGKKACILAILERVIYCVIFLVSLNKNSFKQIFYLINTKCIRSVKGKSAFCDEDKFVTQSHKMPNSFDTFEHKDISDTKIRFREMKTQCLKIKILGHLYMKSIKNKFDALPSITGTNINILTKLYDSIP